MKLLLFLPKAIRMLQVVPPPLTFIASELTTSAVRGSEKKWNPYFWIRVFNRSSKLDESLWNVKTSARKIMGGLRPCRIEDFIHPAANQIGINSYHLPNGLACRFFFVIYLFILAWEAYQSGPYRRGSFSLKSQKWNEIRLLLKIFGPRYIHDLTPHN